MESGRKEGRKEGRDAVWIWRMSGGIQTVSRKLQAAEGRQGRKGWEQ